MGWILLILVLLFIFWPLIRIGWALHRTRSRLRKAYEQAYEQAYGTPPPGARGGRRRRQDPPHKPRRRKIIPRDVGEYVDFQEVAVHDNTSGPAAPPPFKPESQIEDAEWEDI